MFSKSLIHSFKTTSSLFNRNFASFANKELTIERTKKAKVKPPFDNNLKFGTATTDHIFEVDWEAKSGWQNPRIVPYHNFEIDPCNATLHYAIECFEGMKAFVHPDGNLSMFRPDKNMDRLRTSCERVSLPDFSGPELLKCIGELLKVDRDWMPNKEGFSMYIRPTAISMTNLLGVRASDKAKIFVVLSPCGPYFADGFKPLKIFAESKYVRAFYGGSGHFKLGSNYAPSIMVSSMVEKKGYHQVLWLTENKITEIGASNFFFLWINENGEKELVTAPVDGIVLPGVTRDSILTICKEMKQFKVSERYVDIVDFCKAAKENRIIEAFGAGTAVTVGPVELLHYDGVDYKIPIDPKLHAGALTRTLNDKIKDIQYGRIKHSWNYIVQ